MATITGKAHALVSRYTAFDPAKPEDTPAHQFFFVSGAGVGDDGRLTGAYADGGYVLVGTADIAIEVMSLEQTTANAVASLEQEMQKVQADAQRKVMAIKQQLNGLLAIADGKPAWPSAHGAAGDPDIPF